MSVISDLKFSEWVYHVVAFSFVDCKEGYRYVHSYLDSGDFIVQDVTVVPGSSKTLVTVEWNKQVFVRCSAARLPAHTEADKYQNEDGEWVYPTNISVPMHVAPGEVVVCRLNCDETLDSVVVRLEGLLRRDLKVTL